MKLPASYFLNNDVVLLAKDLLGKIIFTQINGVITAGVIVETEAYFGVEDKASHAYGGRRTARTEILYAEGGVAYVYLCYGIHYLLNIVTSVKDDPKCVLIRSIEPFEGLKDMELRRKMPATNKAISSGPGSLSKSLGIDYAFNKQPLTGDKIWIEDRGISYDNSEITVTPRIGISYAQEHAFLPLRFFVTNSRYVKHIKQK